MSRCRASLLTPPRYSRPLDLSTPRPLDAARDRAHQAQYKFPGVPTGWSVESAGDSPPGPREPAVDLFEVGPTSRTEIGSTSKPKAKLRFQPSAAGGAETREIRATVFQNGVPRGEEQTIATYEIGADGTLLGKPQKLKAKRKKDKLTAKWKGGCGAVGYKVVVRTGKKKVVEEATITKTKLKLKKIPKKGKLRVQVVSIADSGSVSSPSGAKVR